MKTILVGTIAFVIWSSVSTYIYVCQIKGLCPEEIEQLVSSVEVTPDPELVAEAPEPEPEKPADTKLVSPGSYILHHNYNRDDFVADGKFDDFTLKLEVFLEQNPTSKVSVIGYSDNIGPKEFNHELGLRRAAFVKNHLVNQGIPASSIVVDSDGATSPVAENSMRTGRAKNRRTEIKLK